MSTRVKIPAQAKETARELRRLGFEHAGYDGSTHLIRRHPLAPSAVLRMVGTPRIGGIHKGVIAQARQILAEVGIRCDDVRRLDEVVREAMKRHRRPLVERGVQ